MSIFASLSASKQSSLPGPSTTTFRATRRVEAEAEEEEDQIPIPEAQQRPSRLRLDRAAANRFIVNAVRAAEAKGKEQIQSQERAKQKSLLPNNAKHQWPSANAQTNKKSLPKRTTTATTATTATAKRKPLKSTAEVTAADSNDAPKKRATTAKTTVKKKSVAAKKKKLLLMKKQNPLNRNGERESDHDDAAADDGNVKGAKRKKTRGWLVRQFPEVLLAVPSLPPLCSSGLAFVFFLFFFLLLLISFFLLLFLLFFLLSSFCSLLAFPSCFVSLTFYLPLLSVFLFLCYV
ncbi:Gustatory receptor, variant 2 [Balamuthia mandrillaris]